MGADGIMIETRHVDLEVTKARVTVMKGLGAIEGHRDPATTINVDQGMMGHRGATTDDQEKV